MAGAPLHEKKGKKGRKSKAWARRGCKACLKTKRGKKGGGGTADQLPEEKV